MTTNRFMRGGVACARKNRCAPMGRSYPEGQLGPMHYGPAVEKFHDAGLDRRWSIVREHGRRDDHVAAIVEDDRYRGLVCRLRAESA